MTGPRNLLIATAFLLAAINLAAASATDVYVAQNPAGANSGADCADAHSGAWFNNAANWGSGATQIGPGTTVHLCGIVTINLAALGSGTSGSPITIYFEAGAKISLSTCTGSGCLNLANRSYIIVDGGAPCGWVNGAVVNCNGMIESTASGTGLANVVSSFGIVADNCANCEIRNLSISDMYQHTSTSDTPSGDYRGIQNLQGTPSGKTFIVHNNIIHDAGSAIVYVPTGASDNGLQIYNNYTYSINSSVDISNNNNGTLTAAVIHDNHFGSTANWDSTGCFAHHNSLHAFAYTTYNSGIDFYDNLIDGDWGNCSTGGLFIEGSGSINKNVRVFNNLWLISQYMQMNNGMVSITGGGYIRVYNNTIIGTNTSDICLWIDGNAGANIYTENNIISGCNTLVASRTVNLFVTWDDNLYGGNPASPWTDQSSPPSWYSALSAWQSHCNCDAHSTFGSSPSFVGVDPTGHLQSSSPAVGAGANLTVVGIAALDSDIAGLPRPSGSTPWDLGVYNYSTRGAPNPPSGLTAAVQ